MLVDKINQGTKTLDDCMNYIKQEAKKLAVGGCAAVADSTVFGWAVHFFEEDSIKAPEKVQTASVQVEPKKEKKTEVKKQTPLKKDPKEEPQLPGQMNILDFLGGM